MPHPINLDEFIPHDEALHEGEIVTALADLNPRRNLLGLSIPLPYTRREDGTVDTIEIGQLGGTSHWAVYTGRAYRGGDFSNITATVGYCPGHMVLLVVRALYTYLMAVASQGRPEGIEGDILYALGLVRPIPTEG